MDGANSLPKNHVRKATIKPSRTAPQKHVRGPARTGPKAHRSRGCFRTMPGSDASTMCAAAGHPDRYGHCGGPCSPMNTAIPMRRWMCKAACSALWCSRTSTPTACQSSSTNWRNAIVTSRSCLVVDGAGWHHCHCRWVPAQIHLLFLPPHGHPTQPNSSRSSFWATSCGMRTCATESLTASMRVKITLLPHCLPRKWPSKECAPSPQGRELSMYGDGTRPPPHQTTGMPPCRHALAAV